MGLKDNFWDMTLWLLRIAALKISITQLKLLADIDILQTIEKEVKEGICHSGLRYAKANNKCLQNYNGDKYLLYLTYWDKK